MHLLPADKNSVQAVQEFEAWAKTQPQIYMPTHHNFWAGCYTRTIMIPKDVAITGVTIKIPTILIICGHVIVNGGKHFTGFNIIEGNAGRKNAFHALTDTWLTMIFATNKTSVEEVEKEFTDELDNLGSRKYATFSDLRKH